VSSAEELVADAACLRPAQAVALAALVDGSDFDDPYLGQVFDAGVTVARRGYPAERDRYRAVHEELMARGAHHSYRDVARLTGLRLPALPGLGDADVAANKIHEAAVRRRLDAALVTAAASLASGRRTDAVARSLADALERVGA